MSHYYIIDRPGCRLIYNISNIEKVEMADFKQNPVGAPTPEAVANHLPNEDACEIAFEAQTVLAIRDGRLKKTRDSNRE